MDAYATQSPRLDQAPKPQAVSVIVRIFAVVAFLVVALGVLRWAGSLIAFSLDPFILGWAFDGFHTLSEAAIVLGHFGALAVLGWLLLQPDASNKAPRALRVSAALWGIAALGHIVSIVALIPTLREYNPELLPYAFTMLPAAEVAFALLALAAAGIAGVKARQREDVGRASAFLRGALVCIVLVWVFPLIAFIPSSRVTGFMSEAPSIALQLGVLTLNTVALFFIYWLVKGFLDGVAETVLANRATLVAVTQSIFFVAVFGATNYAVWSLLGSEFRVSMVDTPGLVLAVLAWAYAVYVRGRARAQQGDLQSAS
jgi:hypothetical protein